MRGGSLSVLLVAFLLLVGTVMASRKRLLAPSPAFARKKRMPVVEAAAKTLQTMFVLAALFIFTLTYASSVSSTPMFWAFMGSMGVVILAHLYLFFKKKD